MLRKVAPDACIHFVQAATTTTFNHTNSSLSHSKFYIVGSLMCQHTVLTIKVSLQAKSQNELPLHAEL